MSRRARNDREADLFNRYYEKKYREFALAIDLNPVNFYPEIDALARTALDRFVEDLDQFDGILKAEENEWDFSEMPS